LEVGRGRRRGAVLLPEPAVLLLVLLLLRQLLALVLRRPGHEARIPAAGALRVEPAAEGTLCIEEQTGSETLLKLMKLI